MFIRLQNIKNKLKCLALALIFVGASMFVAVDNTVHAAATYPAGFSEQVVAGGLNQPIAMEFAPDGRLFVTEKGGNVRIIQNGNLLPVPFATITVDSSVERGLIGLTLDPNFASNGYVYIHYMTPEANGRPIVGRVTRLTANPANPNVVQSGSEKILIDNIPSNTGIHDAGEIKFGLDGKLYVPTGDTGFAFPYYSQEMNNIAGKVLRINSDGTIPNDNPYIGINGIRPEIYASGLRNPFSMAVEPGTGRIVMNEVGYNNVEEINVLQKGANYGWPSCEGRCDNPAYTNPIYQYDHSFGRSITAGTFYYGTTYPEQYYGTYFFGDYSTGFIKNLDINRTGSVSEFGNQVNFAVNLKTGPDGLLYFASIYDGAVYKINYLPQSPPQPPGAGNGLYATYFNNRTFTGAPALARVDSTVNFDFQGGSPSPAVNPDQFTARWTGQVLAQYSEPYTFSVTGDDGYRLFVDNKLIIDKFVDQPATTTNGTLQLEAGKKYDIKLEYYEAYGNASIQMFWSSPSQQRQVIPASQLFSRAPGEAPTVTIDTPEADGSSFTGGQTINFSGSAIDPEDGVLPSSAYSWKAILYHDVHTHPFYGPVTNIKSGSFTIPINSEASANSYYQLSLTVTDSAGQTTTKTQNILPVSVPVTYTSNITGAKLLLDSTTITAPLSETNVVGIGRSIEAPETQTVNGVNYRFTGWSDGQARAHNIRIPATATTYTAQYEAVTTNTGGSPTTVKIYAAGTPAAGVYPTARLEINGVAVKTFENIRGNPDARQFVEFSYDSPTAVRSDQVKISFTNDAYISSEDRNLRVDKIIIGSTTYETEAADTYSTGTWAPADGCNAGNKKSEWLQCGGAFTYGGASTTPTPTPPPTATGSNITVYAAGTPAGGAYPTLEIFSSNQSIQKITDIRGNPDARQFTAYTFNTTTKITLQSLRIAFTNDLYQNGEDRNVRVDAVVIDGVRYEVEGTNTYSTGTWAPENGCSAGNKKSEWLQCGGAFTFN
ncbi:MAG: PQQ-dependent sugar dehydrogenase [bacterium]|nr:PQQ-dependent sugar dehydrogenase [bacterium]